MSLIPQTLSYGRGQGKIGGRNQKVMLKQKRTRRSWWLQRRFSEGDKKPPGRRFFQCLPFTLQKGHWVMTPQGILSISSRRKVKDPKACWPVGIILGDNSRASAGARTSRTAARPQETAAGILKRCPFLTTLSFIWKLSKEIHKFTSMMWTVSLKDGAPGQCTACPTVHSDFASLSGPTSPS